MSITVKNIAFSINGTPSKQYNIELDGAKYSLDKFKMTQKLLEPCKLEFSLCKAPDEDINEIQFTKCRRSKSISSGIKYSINGGDKGSRRSGSRYGDIICNSGVECSSKYIKQ